MTNKLRSLRNGKEANQINGKGDKQVEQHKREQQQEMDEAKVGEEQEKETQESETLENQEHHEVTIEEMEGKHEQQEASTEGEVVADYVELPSQIEDTNDTPLNIDDLVRPGKFGITNSQMIPAIKQVISEGSVVKLKLLRNMYLYSFEKSLKYLKKSEREFIHTNLK